MRLRNRVLCSLSAAALLGSAHSAAAQAQAQAGSRTNVGGGELEEVVVIGLRASMEAAAEIKQNADQVVDSIVADDIGKFPDNTTAAALQRVPGVQVFVGDNNEIVNPLIRGIPDILTTLDGREIFSGVSRGFAFQDLPAEALGRADVLKSNTADLIEGGVAGVINLKLHKPFDFAEGLSGAVNARGIQGDNADDLSYTGGALISNRWAAGDGEMGALLDVSYSDIYFDRPISFNCDEKSFNATPGGAGFVFPTCAGGLNQFGDYQRPQVNGAFQWRPSDNLELYADGIYMEYESRWETDFIFTDPFFAQSITNVQPTSDCGTYRVNGAGFFPPNLADPPGAGNNLTQNLCAGGAATFNNVPGLTSTQAKDSGTEQWLLATGARWSAGALQLDADVSFQRSHNANRTIIVDIRKSVAALDLVLNDDKHGTINMPGNPLGNAAGFTLAALFEPINDSLGKEFTFASNGKYDLDGALSQLQFGVRYADRDADFRAADRGTGGGNVLISSTALPADFLVRSPSSISYINDGAHWLTPDRDFLLDQTDRVRAVFGLSPGDPAWDPARNFSANEKTYAGYLQGKYRFAFGSDLVLDGLIGARVTRTDRSLAGTGRVDGVLTPVTTDTSDTDVLPNLSARLRITPELQARFTAAKTLARPAFGDLNPGLFYNVPVNVNLRPAGSGGNPNLEPQKSDAYDATLEYYFARSSYLSAAVYYRDLQDRIISDPQQETIDGIDYIITRPRNVGSATLQGLELSGQVFLDAIFDSLPDFLSGFGFMANYTLADSEVKTESDPLFGRPLLGVSKHSYNLGVLYEKYGVTGRLVYTRRSDYDEFILCCTARPVGSGEGTVDPDLGSALWLNKVYASGRLDMSIGYDVTPNVTVSLDGTNLTSENYYSYFQYQSLPHDVRDDERTFGASLRVRF